MSENISRKTRILLIHIGPVVMVKRFTKLY